MCTHSSYHGPIIKQVGQKLSTTRTACRVVEINQPVIHHAYVHDSGIPMQSICSIKQCPGAFSNSTCIPVLASLACSPAWTAACTARPERWCRLLTCIATALNAHHADHPITTTGDRSNSQNLQNICPGLLPPQHNPHRSPLLCPCT
jgi:hypothetical protein